MVQRLKRMQLVLDCLKHGPNGTMTGVAWARAAWQCGAYRPYTKGQPTKVRCTTWGADWGRRLIRAGFVTRVYDKRPAAYRITARGRAQLTRRRIG